MKKTLTITLLILCLLALPVQAKAPSKKKQFTGVVNVKELNVRTWAGVKNPQVFFSPLHKGNKVDVCDTVKASNGNPWFYIKYKGHYGFVRAKYITRQAKKETNADRFVNYLSTYGAYIKTHRKSFQYRYDGAIDTFAKAKAKVSNGKQVGITCVVPVRWGMHDMKIKRKDGSNLVYAENGTFKKTYTGDVKKKLKRITAGGPIGKGYKDAVAHLKKGDLIAYKGRTHTAVYSGSGYVFFDSGRVMSEKTGYKNGIKVDYSGISFYKELRVSEVLRWR